MSQRLQPETGIAPEPLSALATRADAAQSGEERVIAAFHYSQARTLGLMLAAGLAAAASGAMAFGYLPVRGGIGIVAGYIGVIFFGTGLAIYIARLFERRPVVVVSKRGLYDRRLAPGVIPWSEFASLTRGVADRAEFVWFELKPGAEARLGISGWMRLRGRLNGPRRWTGYAVSMTTLAGSLNDLVKAINEALAGSEHAPA